MFDAQLRSILRPVPQIVEEGKCMEINEKVPDFSLKDDSEKTVHLKDFAGKPVVLFFYPRADTPGCTIEACGFRDQFKKIQNTGAVVLGISRDTPKAQQKFREKYDL